MDLGAVCYPWMYETRLTMEKLFRHIRTARCIARTLVGTWPFDYLSREIQVDVLVTTQR